MLDADGIHLVVALPLSSNGRAGASAATMSLGETIHRQRHEVGDRQRD
jgi:hypothetical protein